MVGITLTTVFELTATDPFQLLEYSTFLLTVPVLGTGFVPLLQWITLPMPILWLARSQIRGGLR